ncbi:alpha/beta hydrolase [Paucibacter sp. B2R-40]|uniref:alpha/beta fold hydrolase n=1 Tax=Paucibacter sp. B2R-40 TaxID=2893554 RepID=UPI0021E401AE|nr:alpha/beta hydrolase [Paucibacter sp. B2R-40]MCV2354186.1 alpha/beta hydrolase [Paucibacter sp. B2R-40]
MTEPQLKFVQCLGSAGLRRMAYWEWACSGAAAAKAPVLVCVHGLTRQGRDFDALARRMSESHRVICPDVAGRGRSDWLPQPFGYQIPTYVADMVVLLARLDVEQVDWVGTSMGGLIGMGLAALPASSDTAGKAGKADKAGTAISLVRRMVLNDVGPELGFEALQRIGSYLGQHMSFDSLEQGAAYLSSISQGFGPHSAAQWAALSAPMFKPVQGGAGGVCLHYDPQLAAPFAQVSREAAEAGTAALWQAYDSLTCPTLLLRGADSDLLSSATAQAMTQRGPRAQLHEFAGVGHAPTLVQADQIEVVREFFGAV